jgi:hypothetical protein
MKVGPEIGWPGAASLTDEQGFKIGQPDIVGPSVSTDPSPMVALVVRAIDQQAANADFEHFTQRYFLLGLRQSLASAGVLATRSLERGLLGSRHIHASQAREAPEPPVLDRFWHGL